MTFCCSCLERPPTRAGPMAQCKQTIPRQTRFLLLLLFPQPICFHLVFHDSLSFRKHTLLIPLSLLSIRTHFYSSCRHHAIHTLLFPPSASSAFLHLPPWRSNRTFDRHRRTPFLAASILQLGHRNGYGTAACHADSHSTRRRI